MRGKLLLLGFSLFFALLAGELAVRILLPSFGWRLFADERIGWASPEYKRFDPLAEPYEPGRLLFLGDSFLAGAAVESFDERFPIVFAQTSGRDVQILAGGGWGTDQELWAFRQKGKSWRPEHVVLCFCPTNDLANLLSNWQPRNKEKAYYVLDEAGRLSLFSSEGEPIADTIRPAGSQVVLNSYLFDVLRCQFGRVQARLLGPTEYVRPTGPPIDPRYTTFAPYDEPIDEICAEQPSLSYAPQAMASEAGAFIHEDFPVNAYQWRLLEVILAALAADCDAIDAELTVMLLPVPIKPGDLRFVAGGDLERVYSTPAGPITFRAAEPRDRLAAMCARLAIRFFDPTGEFIETVRRRDIADTCWPNPDDRHFGTVGHQILADEFGRYFSELSVGKPVRPLKARTRPSRVAR